MRERPHDAFVAEEPVTGEEGPAIIYRVHTLSELIPWLLGCGASAEALKLAQLLT